MPNLTVSLPDDTATAQLAAKIARYIYVGDIIALQGGLGTGKTTFARAFIRAMAAQGAAGSQATELTVPSPTFTLVQTYDATRLPVAHVDCYRLSSPEELVALDLEPYFTGGVTLIEWPEKAEGAIPSPGPDGQHLMESETPDRLSIYLEETADGGRTATLSAQGSWAVRFGLLEATAGRPVTPEGRNAFLQSCGYANTALRAVSKDCSFRSYWRCDTPDGRRIIMDAPPPMEQVKPFMKLAGYFESIGIHVPHIYEADTEAGYLLLEDLGNRLFSRGFNEGADQQQWLEATVDMLLHIARSAPAPDVPRYTPATAWAEASRYTDWYLPWASGHATDPADRAAFRDIWLELGEKAMAGPTTTCHWDFHSDNLMMLGPSPGRSGADAGPGRFANIGVIDFQDARIGPVAFDLSCLLEDRYPTPPDMRDAMIKRFVDGLDGAITMDDFMASYNLCLLHRAFKVTGLYVRLIQRDGRDPAELPWDMARLWAAIDRALEHPAAASLKAFIRRVQPAGGHKSVRAASA